MEMFDISTIGDVHMCGFHTKLIFCWPVNLNLITMKSKQSQDFLDLSIMVNYHAILDSFFNGMQLQIDKLNISISDED